MENKKIYNAIIGVMSDIGGIAKNQENRGYGGNKGYMFRGIDQVYNALQPALIKNRVFPVPIVEHEERTEKVNAKGTVILYSRLHVNYRFYADDGSYVEAKVIGEAMDSGDKATNKAMSAAYKYACFQIFCIPTEEMIDSERDTYEVAQPKDNPVDKAISQIQAKSFRALMQKKGYSEKMILDWLKIESIESMTLGIHNKAVEVLQKRPDAGAVDLGL